MITSVSIIRIRGVAAATLALPCGRLRNGQSSDAVQKPSLLMQAPFERTPDNQLVDQLRSGTPTA
jgi:hypothetical protein